MQEYHNFCKLWMNCKLSILLWKSAFWKTGYFITTTGGANIETIRQYIERQREK